MLLFDGMAKLIAMASAVGVGFATFVLLMIICVSFGESAGRVIAKVIILPIVLAVFCYCTSMAQGAVAIMILIAVLFLMFITMLWWIWEGSSIREFLCFFFLDLMMTLIALSAASRITDLTSIRWIVGTVRALPVMFLLLCTGVFIADIVWFRKDLNSEDFDASEYLDEEELGGEVG